MAAAATNGPREKVTFTYNVPQYVILDGPGTEQASSDGAPEYRYFLRDRKIMWVPPDAHAAIVRAVGDSGQFHGAEFQITRCKRGRSAATWTVEQIAEEPPAAQELANTSTAPQSRPAPAGDYERTAQGWTYREPPRPAPTPAPAAPQQQQQQQQPANDAMYTALCAAIRTAAAAEQFAAQIGRPIAFDTADVRAIASTLYIRATGGGR